MITKPLIVAITNKALKNPSAQTDPGYISNVLQTVFNLFMIVGVVYFIWHFIFAGYHFISAQGDEKQYQQAKSEVTYALIGLGVVFVVFAVLRLIGLVTGIQGLDTLQLTLPSFGN